MTLARFGFAVTVIAMAFWAPTQAQDSPNNIHQQTSAPANARYEIVQSELAAKLTFRLDRFTGHISQLVHTKNDNDSWEATPVVGLPTVSSPSRPRFHIFTSGLAGRHTF